MNALATLTARNAHPMPQGTAIRIGTSPEGADVLWDAPGETALLVWSPEGEAETGKTLDQIAAQAAELGYDVLAVEPDRTNYRGEQVTCTPGESLSLLVGILSQRHAMLADVGASHSRDRDQELAPILVVINDLDACVSTPVDKHTLTTLVGTGRSAGVHLAFALSGPPRSNFDSGFWVNVTNRLLLGRPASQQTLFGLLRDPESAVRLLAVSDDGFGIWESLREPTSLVRPV